MYFNLLTMPLRSPTSLCAYITVTFSIKSPALPCPRLSRGELTPSSTTDVQGHGAAAYPYLFFLCK